MVLRLFPPFPSAALVANPPYLRRDADRACCHRRQTSRFGRDLHSVTLSVYTTELSSGISTCSVIASESTATTAGVWRPIPISSMFHIIPSNDFQIGLGNCSHADASRSSAPRLRVSHLSCLNYNHNHNHRVREGSVIALPSKQDCAL